MPTQPRLRQWIRHAFAIEKCENIQPDPEQKAAVEKILVEVNRRRLTMPAMLFLESSRPLNYLGAQAMHFFAPFAELLVSKEAYRSFGEFLERRGSIDYLIRRLQELEDGQAEKLTECGKKDTMLERVGDNDKT